MRRVVLFIYLLFTYGLHNITANISDHMASNNEMTGKSEIVKVSEGAGHDVT
jgi:hypothetical protein